MYAITPIIIFNQKKKYDLYGEKFLAAIHLYIWCKSTKNQLEISIRHLIFRDKIC